MLKRINGMSAGKFKQYVFRVVSLIFSIALFVVMLPLTIGLSLIMLFAGMATLAALRYRLRKAGIDNAGISGFDKSGQDTKGNHKQPIEGSYTVIK